VWSSLVSLISHMFVLCSNGYILLNLCLGIILFSFGVKDPIVIINVYPTFYLVEDHKLIFVANALHVPCLNLNMKLVS
jgi:hypothetical protein